VLILRKNRTASDILFVDASREFEKLKKQNHLRPEDVDKIVDTVVQRKEIEKYSHLATLDEIKENDYNLNIPRYVDTYEEEPPVDLVALNNDIKNTNEEIKKVEAELLAMLDDLVVTEETQALIDATKEVFGG
ncbi:MAG: N-6 DNA methylase, partial [Finegoldia magna]|nr:N-6 DNA methylase [Finegoldia magna]